MSTILKAKKLVEYPDPDYMGTKKAPKMFIAIRFEIRFGRVTLFNKASDLVADNEHIVNVIKDAILDGDVDAANKLAADLGTDIYVFVTADQGYVVSQREARREALESLISYFEDEPDNIQNMNHRCGTNFRSPRSAARYVIATDGEYHGLDVHDEIGRRVYITHSCGCLHNEIVYAAPEMAGPVADHLRVPSAETCRLMAAMV